MILSFISQEQTNRDTMLSKIMGWLGIRHHVPGTSFWTTFLPQYLSAVQVRHALELTERWGKESMLLQAEYLKGSREEQYANRELIEDALDSLEAMFYHALFEELLAVQVDLRGGLTESHPLLTPEQQYGYSELARHWLGYRFRGVFQRPLFGDCSMVTARAYLMLRSYLSHIPAPPAIEPESLL